MAFTIAFSRPTVKTLAPELQAALRLGDGRRSRHIAAVLRLADGQSMESVMERRGRSRSTVYAWVRALLLDRWASLRRRTSSGRPSKLTPTQNQRLCDLVTAGPEAGGYPTGCWNSALLQDLIHRACGVLYTRHYLAEVLGNLGCSYQTARLLSDHLNEEKRREWLSESWPALVAVARRTGALVLFGDEASVAQWGSLASTWAPRGQQPVVKTGGKRKGYTVFGLSDYFSGRLFSKRPRGRFTAESYCAWLEEVLAQTTPPVSVIQDGPRDHTAAKTTAFFTQHAPRLWVAQLPSYSPDYHPIEHLWRNINRQNTHNRYFPEFSDLTTAVDTALSHVQQHPQHVKQLMATYLDEVVALAAAASSKTFSERL